MIWDIQKLLEELSCEPHVAHLLEARAPSIWRPLLGNPIGTGHRWVWALLGPFTKAQRNSLFVGYFFKLQKPPHTAYLNSPYTQFI